MTIITVLSMDPTEWQGFHCDKSTGNKKKKAGGGGGKILDHKPYNLNTGHKEWATHSEAQEYKPIIWIGIIKNSHNTPGASEKHILNR